MRKSFITIMSVAVTVAPVALTVLAILALALSAGAEWIGPGI
jgi:hypothetical protein